MSKTFTLTVAASVLSGLVVWYLTRRAETAPQTQTGFLA